MLVLVVMGRQALVRTTTPSVSGMTAGAMPPVAVGVGALGRLEAGWKVHLVAPPGSTEPARVEELLVDEGDEVAAGDLLAILDGRARKVAARDEALAVVAGAKAKLALVRAGAKAADLEAQQANVARLQASMESAAADYQRAAALHRNNRLITTEEFDQKRFQAEIARHQFRSAEATLASMREIRPEDLEAAEAELNKSQAAAVRAEDEVATTQVRAPITGRVLKVNARQGEKVGEAGLLEIGDTRQMHAVAEVYERDVLRVRVGQPARVFGQFTTEELVGKVVRIGWKIGRKVVLDNDPIRDTDARVVEVRIELDPTASELVSRLTNARIEVHINTQEPR